MQTIYYDLRDTKGQQKEIEDKISAAAKILREGGLVALPTETVYGLGANGLDPEAVKRIFEVKGRPQDNPLILHVTGAQWLPRYCAEIPPIAYVLARKFWPGPLTMILKRQPLVPDATTAGLDTVGVRCPNHPVTLAIIREAGVPIAAPSANTSGRPSCTTAQDVMEDVGDAIEGVVDGGPCVVGVESTVLDLTCDPPRLLRPGGLPVEDMERLIDDILIMDYNRVLYQGPLADFQRDFKGFFFEAEGAFDLSGAPEVVNLERLNNHCELYTYASEEEIVALLQSRGVGFVNFRRENLTLEDAFIGLTGKY